MGLGMTLNFFALIVALHMQLTREKRIDLAPSKGCPFLPFWVPIDNPWVLVLTFGSISRRSSMFRFRKGGHPWPRVVRVQVLGK